MDLEQVKQFLDENKDDTAVASYLGELRQPTAQDIEGYLDTAEGQKLLQPRLDSYFTKGLNSWKEKTLPNVIEDELKKRNPEMTEEQRRINDLEKKLEEQIKTAQREKVRNAAISHASSKDLPFKSDFLDYFIADDEETTLKNLSAVEEQFQSAVQKAVESKFKNGGREVEQGGNPSTTQTQDLSQIAEEISIRNQ